MTLPPGSRVHKLDHRGNPITNRVGTVQPWRFADDAIGTWRSLVRWDDGYDQFINDTALAVAEVEQEVLPL